MEKHIIFASIGLLLSSLTLAHEDHQHEGLTKAETALQIKAGELCLLNDQGHSLGAVLEKNKKMYRCVKAYGKNLASQTELVWVEVAPRENGLSTLP